MLACLLLFVAIATALGFFLTGANLRERVVTLELPAVVGEIRNDILRQIGTPLAIAKTTASNSFLLDWEAADQPAEGDAAWVKYASSVKKQAGAETVFWVSGALLHNSSLRRTTPTPAVAMPRPPSEDGPVQ